MRWGSREAQTNRRHPENQNCQLDGFRDSTWCKLNLCDHSQADTATVLRGKRVTIVPAVELVPGDMVQIAGKSHAAFCF